MNITNSVKKTTEDEVKGYDFSDWVNRIDFGEKAGTEEEQNVFEDEQMTQYGVFWPTYDAISKILDAMGKYYPIGPRSWRDKFRTLFEVIDYVVRDSIKHDIVEIDEVEHELDRLRKKVLDKLRNYIPKDSKEDGVVFSVKAHKQGGRLFIEIPKALRPEVPDGVLRVSLKEEE